MDINSVTNHASVAYSPYWQNPAGLMSAETSKMPRVAGSAAAASSQAIQTPSTVEEPSAQKETDPDELQKSVEKIQKFVNLAACDMEFSIDEESGRTVVKVVDRETKDVIRQIPSQEALDLAQALDKLQGLLIRQKA
jgi:flagellar protein FlaG